MSKQAFEKKLEALRSIGESEDLDAARTALRKALRDANNFYVSKAAAIVEKLELQDLCGDLREAFERFLEDGKQTDPKCWGKIALIQALANLGYRGAELYIQGFHCVQKEPVWGGESDAGGAVRAVSAMALVDCEIDAVALLRLLVRGLADVDKSVRVQTVRALLRLSRWEGELLIRLKALQGDPEPEVLGACFDAILELEQKGAVEFVGEFIDSDAETSALEAVAALAQSRHETALARVRKHWGRILTPEMRRTIAVALGASPLSEARDFLLEILEEQGGEIAACAVTGLASSRYREEVREKVGELVDKKRSRELAQVFRDEFR